MIAQNSQYQELAEKYKVVAVLGQKSFDKPSPDISLEALRVLERSPKLQKELGDLVKE